MDTKYDLEDNEATPNASEPAVAYNAQQFIHTELAYDVPSSVDIDTFRTIMNACAMNIIAQKGRNSRHQLSDQELEEVLTAYPAYDEVAHQTMDNITKNDYSHLHLSHQLQNILKLAEPMQGVIPEWDLDGDMAREEALKED